MVLGRQRVTSSRSARGPPGQPTAMFRRSRKRACRRSWSGARRRRWTYRFGRPRSGAQPWPDVFAGASSRSRGELRNFWLKSCLRDMTSVDFTAPGAALPAGSHLAEPGVDRLITGGRRFKSCPAISKRSAKQGLPFSKRSEEHTFAQFCQSSAPFTLRATTAVVALPAPAAARRRLRRSDASRDRGKAQTFAPCRRRRET